MSLGLLLVSAATAAKAPAAARVLRQEWAIPTALRGALLLPPSRTPGLAVLEAIPGREDTLVALYDPRDGSVRWRTPPPAGVRWTKLGFGEAGIGATGWATGSEAPDPRHESERDAVLAILNPKDGSLEWSALAPPGSRLVLGADGGVASEGDCELTVRDPRTGEPWETLPGRVLTVDVGPAAAGAPRAFEQVCAARPRLLGAVDGRWIVLAPEGSREGWRFLAVEGLRHPWDVPLGTSDAPPETDWSTSTLWAVSGEGVELQRRNLATGALAWSREILAPGCQPRVRALAVPELPPSLLIETCAEVILLDPHGGQPAWLVAREGWPLVLGEPAAFPEPIRPQAAPELVVWTGADGARLGTVQVPAESLATPWGPGLLLRDATSLSLLGVQGETIWREDLAVESWRVVDDLAVVTLRGEPGRVVIDLDTGGVVGRIEGAAELFGLAPHPRRNDLRLLLVEGDGVRALRVPAR